MAPRPSSQSDPSFRRSISKSSKRPPAWATSGCSLSSNPARKRQSKQVSFAPNGSPHTEQFVADTLPMTMGPLHFHENAQELAQSQRLYRFRIHRSSYL